MSPLPEEDGLVVARAPAARGCLTGNVCAAQLSFPSAVFGQRRQKGNKMKQLGGKKRKGLAEGFGSW
jgi:hypothetical protein